MSGGIAPNDLRRQVIMPTLALLGLGGEGVEELLLGTAMQESGCGARLIQLNGPALGIWQMEPETHDDLWASFLYFRKPLAQLVERLLFPGLPKTQQLVGNLYYSCTMARVQYYRSPRPIPSQGDLEGQAALWKVAYNTALGAGSEIEYLANAKKAGIIA